jgi:hypothetical protein
VSEFGSVATLVQRWNHIANPYPFVPAEVRAMGGWMFTPHCRTSPQGSCDYPPVPHTTSREMNGQLRRFRLRFV